MYEDISKNLYFTNNKEPYVGLNIGDYTYGKPKLIFWNNQTCKIGKFCSIANDTVVMGGGEHRTDWVTTYPFSALHKIFGFGSEIKGHPKSKGHTIIGSDVWIGLGSCILSGVTIGDGAVIGAKSLVSHDVPAYAIVSGVPAKIIKYRFSQSVIKDLLEIKWWDWDLNKISRYHNLLMSADINRFIETVKNERFELNESKR